ncbi:unnamed protein product [Dimorphilus gyrociliatus]|uniref:G-protein coupled receptors family 1 profile domain-containing protein n=1 Tax=Dimorphilus gyrociliatus TaxID=2664684 RepID=A0A7I8W027_9ANNE|nr:unnamed protein product [Dimorphilus gyrociliatus]
MAQKDSTYSYKSYSINDSRIMLNGSNTTKEAENYEEVKKALNSIVTPSLAAFGTIGNLINAFVLGRLRLRRRDESGTTSGFLFLALSDLLICSALLPKAFVSPSMANWGGRCFSLYYWTYSGAVINSGILLSIWLTTSMTLLRYVAICHPMLSWPRKSWHAYICYSIAASIAVSLSFPSFWQLSFNDVHLNGRSTIILDVGPDWARTTSYVYAQLVIGATIPFIILVYCNASLISALRRSLKLRTMAMVSQSSSVAASSRITLVLIVFIMMFVVLVLPCDAMNVVLETFRQLDTGVVLLARAIANCLQIAHFAFSFVLHCCLNARFRHELLAIIFCEKTASLGVGASVPLIVRKRNNNNPVTLANETLM